MKTAIATLHTDVATVPKAIAVPVDYADQFNTDCYLNAEGYRAIINPDTNDLFSILSTKYKIMQHTDVLTKVEECVAKHPEYGTPKRTIKTLSNGAKLQAKYVFPEIDVQINTGDVVHPEVEIRNGYDGIWSFGVLFGAFRLVCSNGLVIGDVVMQFKRKHFNPAQQFLLTDMLQNSFESFSNQTEMWKGWVDKVLTPEQVTNNLETLAFNKKEMKELEVESEVATHATIMTPAITQWVFFNILTQYITHRVASVNRQVELQSRLRKMF